MAEENLIQQMNEQDLIVHYRVIFKAIHDFSKLENELLDPIREQLLELNEKFEAELHERGYTEEDTADLTKVPDGG